MGRRRDPRIGADFFRIILGFTLLSTVVYILVAPQQILKVKAGIVYISFAALTMAVQLYVVFTMCCRLPYATRPLICIDALCGVCWCAGIAALAYWEAEVRYDPRDGDPQWWFDCANAAKWEDTVTVTPGGDYVRYINILWCEVEVDGHQRLVGNGRAREQMRVMIAVSVVSLVLVGAIISWTLWKWNRGAVGERRRDLEGRGYASSDTSSTWSR